MSWGTSTISFDSSPSSDKTLYQAMIAALQVGTVIQNGAYLIVEKLAYGILVVATVDSDHAPVVRYVPFKRIRMTADAGEHTFFILKTDPTLEEEDNDD